MKRVTQPRCAFEFPHARSKERNMVKKVTGYNRAFEMQYDELASFARLGDETKGAGVGFLRLTDRIGDIAGGRYKPLPRQT